MITAKDIVLEIESLGARLSNLNTSDTVNLNLNLGLSNLGLQHQDPKFQNSFSEILSELQAVYEEYKNRPAETHWDLKAVLDAVKLSTNLIHEVLNILAEDEYVVLDSNKYLVKFSEALRPFEKLGAGNYLEPMYISIHKGGDYTYSLHERFLEEYDFKPANALVRINQFATLLNLIGRTYTFIWERLDEDSIEIQRNLDAANEIPRLEQQGIHLKTKIEREQMFLDRLYLNLGAGDATWEDLLWHLTVIFDREYVAELTKYFSEEDGVFAFPSDTGEKIVDYDGIGSALDDIRKMESAYEDKYRDFQEKKVTSLR